jgi:hypothetical protein
VKFISIYTISPEAAAAPPSEKTMAAMGALIGEMQQTGVLLDFGGTGGGGMELRVRKSGSEMTVTDGPFTETKEVVGGFAVLNVATRDEALAWTKRFLECAGDGVSELHQLQEY